MSSTNEENANEWISDLPALYRITAIEAGMGCGSDRTDLALLEELDQQAGSLAGKMDSQSMPRHHSLEEALLQAMEPEPGRRIQGARDQAPLSGSLKSIGGG
jgi:hypothetical protein